jgi:hypothetical protein
MGNGNESKLSVSVSVLVQAEESRDQFSVISSSYVSSPELLFICSVPRHSLFPASHPAYLSDFSGVQLIAGRACD